MRVDLMRGTLDMMILKALTWESMHGYAITRWIEIATEEAFSVEEGSLYPALHRMAKKGWIVAEWGVSDNNRRARYYALTSAGRKQLRAEAATWNRVVVAVGKVLQAQPA